MVWSVALEGKDDLKRMLRQIKRKIFLIVDGHPVHRSVKLKNWLERNTNRIRVFFLPAYSPELNPDEILNQDVKSNAVGRKRAYSRDQLIKNVRSYLRNRQRKPYIVKNYFKEKHVQYASM